MSAFDPSRHRVYEIVPVAGDFERSMPDARRIVAGSTEG